MSEFLCDCGQAYCCMSIGKIIIAAQCACNESPDECTPLLFELAKFPYVINEDGSCPKLDKISNLCTIYHERPRVCSIESMWISHWSAYMSREEWYAQSKISCGKLQARFNKSEAE